MTGSNNKEVLSSFFRKFKLKKMMQDAETNTSRENCVLGHSIHKSLDSFHNC